MNAAQISTTNALGAFLAIVAGHPLLERLFFASLELAALAVLVYAAIRIGRIRSARLASILWLLVLAKPLVSLAIGSPVPLVRMHIPEVAVVVPAPELKLDPVALSPSTESATPQDAPPFTENEGQAFNESEMRPQLPADVAPTSTTPEPMNPEPILAETPPVLAPEPSPVSSNVPTLLIGVWLCGVAVFALRSLIDRIRVRSLVRGARIPDAGLQSRYLSIAAQLGLKRPVPARVTTDLEGPALVGSLFPTVLIPDWLAADPNPARLDWALRHELMHWKLRDPLAGLVREFAQMLFYFHPAAWWAGHRWEVAAEQACDRAIVTSAADSADYAEQLYGILVGMQGRLRVRIGNGLFATRTQIGQRIAALLNGPLTPRAHLSALALIAVTIVAAITLSIGGAFADKNAEHNDSEKPEQAETAPTKEKTQEVPQEKAAIAIPRETTDPKPATNPTKPTNEAAEAKVVHGRALLPNGSPAAGARVTALRRFWTTKVKRTPLASTIADSKGRYSLQIPGDQPIDDVGTSGDTFWIAARADGYGPGWETWNAKNDKAKELELKLVPEVPIHGRIVDLEGRPVRDVRVTLLWQLTPHEGLDAWLEQVRSGNVRGFFTLGIGAELQDQNDGTQAPIVIDREGRFTLREIGAGRVAHLAVEGDRIAYAEIDVVPRAIQPVLPKTSGGDTIGRVFGSDFSLPAGPTQPVVGTVRDAKTGVPLPGVRIESMQLAGQSRTADSVVRTVTDAQGHYRLVGLPKTNGKRGDDRNAIGVVPNDEQPYFMMNWVEVPEKPGLDPVTLDFKLTRGLWITGRVTDKSTGAPVPTHLTYAPSLSNQLAASLPEFKRSRGSIRDNQRYSARPDGTFRLVGLPGKGLVAAHAVLPNYRQLVGASEIPGITKDGRYPTFFGFASFIPNAMKEINPSPETHEVVCDFALESGIALEISLVDRAGKPVNGSFIRFTQPSGGIVLGGGLKPTFKIKGMAPGETRQLLVVQHEQHLGKVTPVRYDEKSPKLTVTLEACATVKGRLVDEDGTPFDRERLEARAQGSHGYNLPAADAETDANGRFEFANVPPGAKQYAIFSMGSGKAMQFVTVVDPLAVTAGQTLDLGDIKRKRQKDTNSIADLPAAVTAAQVGKDGDHDIDIVRGRVLLPDGKPAAGARVLALRQHLTAFNGRRPLGKSIAAGDGRFTISIPKKRAYEGWGIPDPGAWIAAEADGFGSRSQHWVPTGEESKELVLKLVPERPIRGRIIDLEGRPVPNVTVEMEQQETPGFGMDLLLKATKSGGRSERLWLRRGMELPGYEDESQRPTVTDADGRFTLGGAGADRVVRLGLRGETIAFAELEVVTRAMPPMPRRDPYPVSGELYGADFTYQAAPTQPVEGTLRDASSGAPLAGVVIESRSIAGAPQALPGILRTVTDVEGNYRLVGMPKGSGSGDQANAIAVLPNRDQPYFMLNHVKVPETAGLGPTRLDFKLTRGVWIMGRVTDKATGEAVVPARLAYIPSQKNSLAASLPEFKRDTVYIYDQDRYLARPDGSFRVVGLQGRGLVAAWAVNRFYSVGAGASEIAEMTRDGKYPSFWGFESGGAHVVKEINPPPGTTELACDLAFDPGKPFRVSIVDETGKPAGTCFYSFNAHLGSVDSGRAENSTLDLIGLRHNESRPLWIMQVGRRFGKVLHARNDDKAAGGLTVKLEPAATIKGRLLDAEGNPLEGVRLSAAAYGQNYWLPAGQSRSDSAGRFVFDALPPGAEWYWVATDGFDRDVEFTNIAEKVTLAAGKTIDLGDTKLKRKK
jgi:beta-lactamase regulating signal transducer with metallopeptidase domain/protocatechuate 3,4-dioxygenase beta subunit/5-hydroxyisourate hydrolase-like protein (transthyretin family)